jgi:polyferredoxin
MTYIPDELRALVWNRANGCCEYCHLHQDFHPFTYEVDHILPVKHRGDTIEDNLCLTCFECNRFKGSDAGSFDIETKTFTPLFNPRTMEWPEHFSLDAAIINPLTPIGRVTEFLLRLNNESRLEVRSRLMPTGRYPCHPSQAALPNLKTR